jgi:hypothetical protein
MKNSKLLKSCLALSMVLGTNGYLITNVSAEGEGTADTENSNNGGTDAQTQDVTNNEGQGTDSGSAPTTTDYSSLITDSLTYNEDKTLATLTISVNTTDSVTLDFSNNDELTENMTASNYAINYDYTNGTTTYAFNIAKNGTYNFNAIVLDAEGNTVGTNNFIESVTDLTGTGEVQNEYSANEASTFTFKQTIDNPEAQDLAYVYWHTEEDTKSMTASSLITFDSNTDLTFDDYSTSDQAGYIVFLVRPKSENGYLFTGLGASGNGDYYVVGTKNYGNIKDYPGLSNVMTLANAAGYKAVFGWYRPAGSSMTADEIADGGITFEINTIKPTLNVAASVAGSSDVKIGDEITFNVTLTPTVSHNNATVTGVKINSNASATTEEELKEVTTVNGVAVDPNKISTPTKNSDGTYSATVKHTVTEADFDEQHKGVITLNVNASVSYSISIGSTAGDAITTTATVTETGTADPAPTITLKSLDLRIGDDTLSSTEASATSESKTYDGTALSPSVTAKDGDTDVDGITTTYYVKNADGEYEKVDSAPSLTDVGSKSVKVVVSKTGYADSTGYYTLSVNKRSVTFTGNGATKTYNGQTQTVSGYTDTSTGKDTGLISGQTATLTASASGQNASSTPYTGTITAASSVVIKNGNEDVTSNYLITTTPGTLTITKAKGLTISSGLDNNKAEKTYDGIALTATPTTTIADGTTITYYVKNAAGVYEEVGTTPPSITHVGEKQIKAVATNPNYEDATVEYTLKVTKKDVTIKVSNANKVYGQADPEFATPIVSGLMAQTDLGTVTVTRENADKDTSVATYSKVLTATYTDNTDYNVTIEKGNFTIKAQSLDPDSDDYTGATVNSPDDVVYDGKEHAWIPTITSGTTTLGENDYTIKYYRDGVETTDFTNVGEITVVIEGKGNYTGTITKKYTITPAPIEEDDESDTPRFNISNLDSVVYNGTSQEQAPIIKDGENELVEGKDYTITYSEDTTNAGEVTVIIDGIGNYSGKVVKTYAILKAKSTASLTGITTKYNGSNQTLVTDAKAEGGTIYYSSDGKTYSTTMPEKKEAGTYMIYYYVKGDKNHEDLGSETEPLTVEAKITEEAKPETKSKVKTSTATHTLFFETIGVAAAGMFIALKKKMNK